MTTAGRMSLVESLEALHAVRRDGDIVVTAMGAAREWMELGTHPLDFVLVPSSMGQASALGLGLAIAQPEKRVVVFNGDGSTLMNLGSLVTITAEAPANLTLVVCDNEVYEVTGAQATPGAGRARADRRSLDYPALARACGFASIHEFADVGAWRERARGIVDADGPHFVHLAVAPISGAAGPKSPGPGRERALAFRAALNGDA